MQHNIWTIRILLMPYGANLRSEIALPSSAFQSVGILIQAPVLLGLSKWICIWLTEKRTCKCSVDISTLVLSTLKNIVKQRWGKEMIALDSILIQLSPHCLLNESMGRKALGSSAVLSNLQAGGASAARPCAITSFLLKLHYSHSGCSLLSNGLREKRARKTKIFTMGKEPHEEERNSPPVSEAVNLTTPQK